MDLTQDLSFSLMPILYVMSMTSSVLFPKSVGACADSGFLVLVHGSPFNDIVAHTA